MSGFQGAVFLGTFSIYIRFTQSPDLNILTGFLPPLIYRVFVKIVPGKREVLICQSCEILAIIIREDFAVFVKLRDWRKETAAGKRCRFTRFS